MTDHDRVITCDLDRIVLETLTPGVEELADLLMASEAGDEFASEAEALAAGYELRRLVIEEVLRLLSNEGEEEGEER